MIAFGVALAVVGVRAHAGAHSPRTRRQPAARPSPASPAAGHAWRFGAFTVLLVAGAAFLLAAGVGINSYSRTFFPTDAAIHRLQAIVGTSLVGLSDGNDGGSFVTAGRQGQINDFYRGQVQAFVPVGLYPNTNIGYGLHQFTGHDPTLPKEYFTSWLVPVQYPAGGGEAFFFPDIDRASVARHYGISFILAGPHVTTAPPGTRLVATIAGERLYRVPGAAQFAFVPSTQTAAAARAVAADRVLDAKDNGDGSYSLSIDAPRPATLVMRVTDVPGWHVTAARTHPQPAALRGGDAGGARPGRALRAPLLVLAGEAHHRVRLGPRRRPRPRRLRALAARPAARQAAGATASVSRRP